MDFDTTWDVEKYYNPHEPPEHWELRRMFMEVNRTKYPEQKLVSLAATFLNIEALGCHYSPKLMQLVQELSKGVVEEYRERKKLKIQKVFVQASDAAASKVKGQVPTTITRAPNVTDASVPSDVSAIDNSVKELATTDPAHVDDESVFDLSDESPEPDEEFQIELGNNSLKRRNPQNSAGGKKEKNLKKGKFFISEDLKPAEIPGECFTSYGYMVLIEDDDVNVVPKQILERSASLCHAKLSVVDVVSTMSNTTTVKISIGGTEVASATDMGKKKAREIAYVQALHKLQQECFTIKIKRRRYDQRVGKNFGEPEAVEMEEAQKEAASAVPNVPASGSIALKMMANMGWTGGGLGKAQQGITEPISLAVKSNRSGLGIKPKEAKKGNAEKPETAFQKKAIAYLEEYARSNSEQDLVFTTEFTSDERKILHNLAARFDLKSKSYGKQMNRHLVISRKLEPFRIVKTLLTPGYSSEKYVLVRPTCPPK